MTERNHRLVHVHLCLPWAVFIPEARESGGCMSGEAGVRGMGGRVNMGKQVMGLWWVRR